MKRLKLPPPDQDKRIMLDPNAVKYVQEYESQSLEDLADITQIKKLILKLEKLVSKNQEMRSRYFDEPSKFMNSELELLVELKKWEHLSEYPEHFPFLDQFGVLETLCALLTHDNTDISCQIVIILKEWTDEEDIDDIQLAKARTNYLVELIDILIQKHYLLERIINNLNRLDEKDNDTSEGVFNTLGFVENLFSLSQDVDLLLSKASIIPWLLNRIKQEEIDDNKLYSSEILAILVQTKQEIRNQFATQYEGIKVLIDIIYQSKDNSKYSTNLEFIENMFDILCSCLLVSENVDIFIKLEGLELLITLKRHNSRCMRALAYATNTSSRASYHLAHINGIEEMFGLFMTQRISIDNFIPIQEHEYIISIIASMLTNLHRSSAIEECIMIESKFAENIFQGVRKLLFYRYYYVKCLESQGRISELTEDQYFDLLSCGLFTLQQIDLIIAWLWNAESQDLRKIVSNIFVIIILTINSCVLQ